MKQSVIGKRSQNSVSFHGQARKCTTCSRQRQKNPGHSKGRGWRLISEPPAPLILSIFQERSDS
jgi:hypothetical protein